MTGHTDHILSLYTWGGAMFVRFCNFVKIILILSLLSSLRWVSLIQWWYEMSSVGAKTRPSDFGIWEPEVVSTWSAIRYKLLLVTITIPVHIHHFVTTILTLMLTKIPTRRLNLGTQGDLQSPRVVSILQVFLHLLFSDNTSLNLK